jgi:hypothetical protein
MPARHTSLQGIPLFGAVFNPAALVDERGCRRDIRSNGWIVLREFALRNRSGRRNWFSSFGADLWSAISSGPKPAMKSGPDVFADALVPPPGQNRRCILSNPQAPRLTLAIRASQAGRVAPRVRRLRAPPVGLRLARLPRMVIVSRNGRVNRIPL